MEPYLYTYISLMDIYWYNNSNKADAKIIVLIIIMEWNNILKDSIYGFLVY